MSLCLENCGGTVELRFCRWEKNCTFSSTSLSANSLRNRPILTISVSK